MDEAVLRAIGPVLTALGSIFLAVRLEAIIDAILLGMDANLKAVLNLVEPGKSKALAASHKQVLGELRKGKKFLWWGFVLVAIGGVLNALSYFLV